MLTPKEFRTYAHELVDWMADYLESVEKYPVKSQVEPGDIMSKLPETPPESGESMEAILHDFKKIIMPGMTHWQSPAFFAYFNGNSSYPSLLGEMLTATLGAQCMIWDTSPAAAELEERVLEWLKQMLGLPQGLAGVIQDTASSATLCAILTARERFSSFETNKVGLGDFANLRVYCSAETHSSIEKAVKVAGLGKANLVKVATTSNLSMDVARLREAIARDISEGLRPLAVVATIGTTGTTAIDPLSQIARVCARHGLWLHVDAAHAGTALLLPETRWMIEGIEQADSFVFNPHKWLFTNFDCSAYYVKDAGLLVRTFEILPEYLKTASTARTRNYRDWGIALGRRFRALKLWFVIRNYGVEGLRAKIREHLTLAQGLSAEIHRNDEFELMAPTTLNLVCFRYKPSALADADKLDSLNAKLLDELNRSGKIYLTHTRVFGKYTLRMCIGQTSVSKRHVDAAWALIVKTASGLN